MPKRKNDEALEFWKGAFIRSFVMFGFTYFSVAMTLQAWTTVTPSIMSSLLYFFTELGKYYKLQPDRKVLLKPKNKHYSFLI